MSRINASATSTARWGSSSSSGVVGGSTPDPKSYSQHPERRSHHVLQRPELESADPAKNTWIMRTPFIYMETRGDEQQVYGATALHTLTQVDGKLRILRWAEEHARQVSSSVLSDYAPVRVAAE